MSFTCALPASLAALPPVVVKCRWYHWLLHAAPVLQGGINCGSSTYKGSITFHTDLQPTSRKYYGIGHNPFKGRRGIMKKYFKSDTGTGNWGNISLFMFQVWQGPVCWDMIAVPEMNGRNGERFQSLIQIDFPLKTIFQAQGLGVCVLPSSSSCLPFL